MHLRFAYDLAEKTRAILAPMCERIEIAGSIRRARPLVNDINLVFLPKPGQETPLRDRIKRGNRVVGEGPQTLIVELQLKGWDGQEATQLDCWFARPREADLVSVRPSNWGTLLLCRTGSKEHNIMLAQRAQSMGLHWNPHQGLFHAPHKGSGRGDAQFIASETEEDIFSALGLDFVPPALREA